MVSLLEGRTWRDLLAVSRAYRLPFHTKMTKAQARARLYRQLTKDSRLKRQLRKLDGRERAALRTLQAAGGGLPLHQFTKAFGSIRFWRPWRHDTTREPWKQPRSSAERLWYLGLIEVIPKKRGQVVLPDEVLRLLPPLPVTLPLLPSIDAPPRDTVCVDVAHLLSVLLYHDVRPIHRRWLPPTLLRVLNRRLLVKEELGAARSELRAGRLRFVHYLAEAAGLISVQAGYLKPTPEAWRWLRLPSEARWSALWRGLEQDIRRHRRLWQVYRLPEVDFPVWTALTESLNALPPGEYPLTTLCDALSLRLPAYPDVAERIDQLLREPLTWIGRVHCAADRVAVTPTHYTEPQPATVTTDCHGIHLILPPFPHLHALVSCAAWAVVNGRVMSITKDTIATAVERGCDAALVTAALAELIAQPLPRACFERIAAWEREAHHLSLRHLTVLTARHAEMLKQLRADWRLRPLLGELLSPHHLAIRAERAGDLLKRLERRAQRVIRTNTPNAPSSTPINADLAAYFWLAVRVYQKLAVFAPPDIHLPAAARQWLASNLPPGKTDALEAEAALYVNTLRRLIGGRSVPAAPVAQDQPESIQRAVQEAYQRRGALTIEYFSPHSAEVTVRTIEPMMLYERSGAQYVEAWCRLEDAARTFRVDRILRVLPNDVAVGVKVERPPET